MASVCNLNAHVKNKNGIEVESELFKAIQHKVKNHEITKKLWAMASIAKDENLYPGAELDKNGEYTINSFEQIFNIKDILSDNLNALNEAEKLGLIDSKGESIPFKNASTLITAMVNFNDNQKNFVAKLEYSKDGDRMAVILPRTSANLTDVSSIKFDSELNSRLAKLLNKAGFNTEFMYSDNKFGVFDPFNAEKNSGTLKTVIKIAHNEAGLSAFPEEFSHVIFAGLKNTEYAHRLEKVFTPEMAEVILGDEYHQYLDRYKDDEGIESAVQYTIEEAEARVLSSMLKGEIEGVDVLRRFWGAAMKKVSLLSEKEVDDAVKEASEVIGSIKSEIDKGTIVDKIDKEAVLNHRAMFNLEDKVSRLKTIAKKGEELINKRLSLLREKVNIDEAKSEEVKRVSEIRKNLEAQRYSVSCYEILESMAHHIGITLDNIEDYKKIGTSDITNLTQLASRAASVKDATNLIDAYTPYINVLADIQHYVDNGEIELDSSSIKQITESANAALDGLRELTNRMKDLRTDTLLTLIKMYIGKDQLAEIGNLKGKETSIEMLLNQAEDDINFMDANIFSLGDSRNIILNVTHEIIKRQQATRDRQINELASILIQANKKLKDAGETSDFMVERYDDGRPTGNFISFIDYPKYYKARAAYRKSIIEENEKLPQDKRKSAAEIAGMISKWEYKNTSQLPIKSKNEFGEEVVIKERVPKSFHGPEGDGKYYKDINLNKAQQDYWNTIMDIKARLQQVLPSRAQHIFEMPQLYKDISQSVGDAQNLPEALNRVSMHLKHEYSIMEDNTEYGELDENGNPIYTTMTDLSGTPLKTVPVFFVRRIKNTNMLDTDVTQGMIAYASMAINYAEMRKISDALQILNDRIKSDEYRIDRVRGGEKMQDMFRSLERSYKNISTIKGEGSNIQVALEDLIDRNVFGITKNELPTVKLGDNGKSLNTNVAIKVVKDTTSISNLGLNLFSGLNNVVMGDAQLLVEAIGGEHFNIKDLTDANILYSKLLPAFLGKMNSTIRDDKMTLLVNMFNSSEDFTRDIQENKPSSKFFQRVLGKANVYFLQSMGEHKLHTVGMLAMLKHIKVDTIDKDGKKTGTKSLYDCLTVVNDDLRGNYIELTSPIRLNYEQNKNSILKGFYPRGDEDSVLIDNSNFGLFTENLNVYINNVNASMHGGYSEIEKGNANKKALWQLLLQFRQWMPATYNKRFSRPYYDAVLGENKEGFYYTFVKFLWNTTKDLIRGHMQFKLNFNNLTNGEKANLRKAFSEVTMFVVLAVLCSMMKGYEGKDQAWHKKMLAYQLERLKLDTGSMVPTTEMLENMWQILQSPMAGMEGLHNLFNIFKFQNCAVEIQQGRYKGWSVYERDLLKVTPFQSLVKVKDLSTENYMFNIFKHNYQNN